MCPSSPAPPVAPRYSLPSATMPPPTPVPSVRPMTFSNPRAAPSRVSASTKTLTSFSTVIARRCFESRFASRRPRGTAPCQPGRLGELRTTPRSTSPAEPAPRAETLAPDRPADFISASAASAMFSTTRAAPYSAWVGRLSCSNNRREGRASSTDLMLVPPRSMPIAAFFMRASANAVHPSSSGPSFFSASALAHRLSFFRGRFKGNRCRNPLLTMGRGCRRI